MSDAPSEAPPDSSGAANETCRATLDGSPNRRCQLPPGHDGLHRWYSQERSRHFEWG